MEIVMDMVSVCCKANIKQTTEISDIEGELIYYNCMKCGKQLSEDELQED